MRTSLFGVSVPCGGGGGSCWSGSVTDGGRSAYKWIPGMIQPWCLSCFPPHSGVTLVPAWGPGIGNWAFHTSLSAVGWVSFRQKRWLAKG